jgi:hypothetical protein
MATDIEVEGRAVEGISDEASVTDKEEPTTATNEPPTKMATPSIDDNHPELTTTTTCSPNDPHPETEEIIRQVEYYFSDEILPGDAYLLAKSGGDGNGPVPIKSILGFKKMHRYKPKSRVIASIRLSTKIAVIDNKFLQRREPLNIPLRVEPTLGLDRMAEDRAKILREKPWLTRGMLKPTGFEEYATEGPMRPDEYAVERKLYDPEEAFHIRIENAVARYFAKRKMHALYANIFTQFLIFGGFDASQRQFSGGLRKEEMEKMTADEIALAKSDFAIADVVLDGLHDDDELDDNDQPKTRWTVDFLLLTKAFLSSPFLIKFPWTDPSTTQTACTILQNFHNYLLYHDVCPEYAAQILSARDFCRTTAEPELLRLSAIDRALPGSFNIACSTLFSGRWADLSPQRNNDDPFDRDYSTASAEEWAGRDDSIGLSPPDAYAIFATAIAAYGTEAQMTRLEQRSASKTSFIKIHTADVGLETLRVELPSSSEKHSPEAQALYTDPRVMAKTSAIKPLGKLLCKIWTPPHRPSPPPNPQVKFREPLTLLLESSTLEMISPGMKMEATVCSLDLGVLWLDSVQFVYPSFFEWCGNETAREKEVYGRIGRWSEWLEERAGREKGSVDGGGEGGGGDGGVRI